MMEIASHPGLNRELSSVTNTRSSGLHSAGSTGCAVDTDDPVKTVAVLANRYGLNEPERTGVLQHLIEGHDLSAYGLVNAVTHFSQEVGDYDRATEFESLGGKLIDLSQNEWKELVAA